MAVGLAQEKGASQWWRNRLEYIMLLKLPIILSGNSIFIHLLFPKLFQNFPGVIPGIVYSSILLSQ